MLVGSLEDNAQNGDTDPRSRRLHCSLMIKRLGPI